MIDLSAHSLSASTRFLPGLHDWMWRWAPKHPVPMRAVFTECWLVTWRVEPDALAARLPEGLEPEVLHDTAWLSIVIARMADMRPTFLPRPLGVDFDQVVYRAVVRRGDARGVYFLRTEANHRLYAWGGDLLTHFHFHHNPIRFETKGQARTVTVDAPAPVGMRARFDHGPVDGVDLPSGSRLARAQVQEELVDLFHAFSVAPRSRRPGRVTVARNDWRFQLVRPFDVEAPWMTEVLFPGACAVSHGVYATDIPYRWTARH